MSLSVFAADIAAVQSIQIQALDKSDNPVGQPWSPATSKGLVYGRTDDRDDGDRDDHFTLDWKTKGLKAGSYQIVVTLADGAVHTLTVKLKK